VNLSGGDRSPTVRAILIVTLLVWVGFVAVRLSAPSDLMSRDQERVASYVLDVVEGGNWLWQEDTAGNFASKPPLYNWLAALPVIATGELDRLTLSFPSWFATVISCLLLVAIAGRWFSRSTALWVALVMLSCQLGIRQVILVRSDTLFQMFVLLGVFFALRACLDGKSWWPFWLAAIGSVMTKGPLGLLFSSLGLVALLWQRRSKGETGVTLHRRGLVGGALIFIAVPVLWLLVADQESGGRAIAKLLGDEFFGHSLGERSVVGASWTDHLNPIGWFFTRLAPMSWLAIFALVKNLRRPSEDPEERFVERFLFCWLIGGLIILCAASHHRFVHLLALMPPAALLGARQLATIASARSPMIALLALSIVLPFASLYLNVIDGNSPRIIRSEEARRFAMRAKKITGRSAKIEFFRAPTAVQVHLSRFMEPLNDGGVGEILADNEPVWIITAEEDLLRRLAGEGGSDGINVVLRTPYEDEYLVLSLNNAMRHSIAEFVPSLPVVHWPLFLLLVTSGSGGIVLLTLLTGRRVARGQVDSTSV